MVCGFRSSAFTGVRFPTAKVRFEAWVNALRIPPDQQQSISRSYFVCFSHFDEEDLIIENNAVVGVRPEAVPSLPNDDVAEDDGYLLVKRSQFEKLFTYCFDCGTIVGQTWELNIIGANAVYNFVCMVCRGAKGKRKWW
uniref:THAP-type domain-containing protein n=1 Tax=Acrobeloides nanus TaxID=290746 RepID=A0A914BWQ1_9BILA